MAEKYFSASQQRILKIQLFLFGHEVSGVAPGQISKSLGIRPTDVTHDLANLLIAGVAERMPKTGRWRLTPLMPQKSLAMLNGIDRAQGRLDEVKNRYTRTPY